MNLKKLNPIRKIKELGLTKFATIWIGQTISIIGSSMSGYALMFWVWNETGTATSMVLMTCVRAIPSIILMPFAGSIVDRLNRKTVIMFSDAGAAVVTTFLMIVLLAGKMSLAFVYVAGFFEAVFNTFHWLAKDSLIVQIVPNSQLGRVSGMRTFVGSLSGVIAPLLAGGLVAVIGYAGVFAIDLATFSFAFLTIAIVKIPTLPKDETRPNNVFKDAMIGFKYFLGNQTLLWIVIINIFSGVVFQFGALIINPMILAKTNGSTITIGIADAWMSVAGLIGSLILMAWGGPKRRFLVSNVFYIGLSFGLLIFGIGNSIFIWCLGGFVWMLCGSLSGISNAFFSSKIPAAMQGRVFGAMGMASELLAPLSFGFAGVLADNFFEPLMANPGFASKVSWLVGTGKGSGMGLMIIISGVVSMLLVLPVFFIKPLRDADILLPDVNNDLACENENAQS